MGFVFRGLWQVVLIGALLTIVCGYAITNAVMNTGGEAIGGGLRGTGTFLSAAGSGFREADAYEDALSEAKANQAAKEQAAKDKRAAAKKAEQKKAAGGS